MRCYRVRMNDTNELPEELRLSPIEARILGCLVEKEATTPEQYPLTENSTLVACNQKTSREPIMELSPGEVGHALRQLEGRGLVRSVHGARAQRYEHRVAAHYSLTALQQALLALLMLRGPQTLAELISRSERMARSPSPEGVRHALERLLERATPLVVRLPKQPGQREERWAQLLTGAPDLEALAASEARSAPTSAREREDELMQRISALQARVTALEAARGSSSQE
jgi:uncharacterized protein YceH (UPF0502 family)